MHVLNRFWIRTSNKRQASWRNLGGRKPLGGRLFSCLRLGGFLANDCHCGPQEQDDQDCLGEGFQENLLSYYWFSPSARRTCRLIEISAKASLRANNHEVSPPKDRFNFLSIYSSPDALVSTDTVQESCSFDACDT